MLFKLGLSIKSRSLPLPHPTINLNPGNILETNKESITTFTLALKVYVYDMLISSGTTSPGSEVDVVPKSY